MNRWTPSLLLVAACSATVLNCQLLSAQSEPPLPGGESYSFQLQSIDLQPARLANYEVDDREAEHEKITRCEHRRASRNSIFSYLPFVGRLFGGSVEWEFCPCEMPAQSAQATWRPSAQTQAEPQLQLVVQQPRVAALRALLAKRAVHNRELRNISDIEQIPNTGCDGIAAGITASSWDKLCRCSQGGPCEAKLHVPDGGVVIMGGTRPRLAIDGYPTSSSNRTESCCANACCADVKACAACESISPCKCEGQCKCCDESRGENCACSNCACAKQANSDCKCAGQLLPQGSKIDSPEALSAFVTNVVKQHAGDPSKQQLVEALVALATENFKMHVQMHMQMLVHGNEHQSAEAVDRLRQEVMQAQLENARMQAQVEASEKLLKIAGELYENPRNYMPQPVFSPQVMHVPPQFETWQAPVRLATPQPLPAPYFPPAQPVYPQPVQPPTSTNSYQTPESIQPAGAAPIYLPGNQVPRPDSNIQSSLPHPSTSFVPQLRQRIEQLERAIAMRPEARIESASCLPRPMYPSTRVESVQFSTPRVDVQSPVGPALMMVTPRSIIQEVEEVLVPSSFKCKPR